MKKRETTHALNPGIRGIVPSASPFHVPGCVWSRGSQKKKLFLAPLDVKRRDPGKEVKGHLQGSDFYVYSQLNRLLIKNCLTA